MLFYWIDFVRFRLEFKVVRFCFVVIKKVGSFVDFVIILTGNLYLQAICTC